MKRISTPYTFSLRVFPFLFGGILSFIFILVLMNGALQKAPMFLALPCVMAVLGYYAWKANCRDLMDEVDDCGDYLLVKKRGEEDTVLLSNIARVQFSTAKDGAQGRITLTLDRPGKFGQEISFAPPPHFYLTPAPTNGIAEDLVVRADRARQGNLAGLSQG